MVERVDWRVVQGDSFAFYATFPFDPTADGYTLQAQARPSHGSVTVWPFTITAAPTAERPFRFHLRLAAAQTRLIGRAVYDVEVVDSLGEPRTHFGGTIVAEPDVTR